MLEYGAEKNRGWDRVTSEKRNNSLESLERIFEPEWNLQEELSTSLDEISPSIEWLVTEVKCERFSKI